MNKSRKDDPFGFYFTCSSYSGYYSDSGWNSACSDYCSDSCSDYSCQYLQ